MKRAFLLLAPLLLAAGLAGQISPNGAEFQVNSYIQGSQVSPDVGSDPRGSFVVVWTSDGSAGTDVATESIQARRFNAQGSPIGADFQVNTYTTGTQRNPAVASDLQGRFVVVWTSYGSNGPDNDGSSVWGQRFAADGSPLGGEFQVNVHSPSNQGDVDVTALPNGGFVVAWWSFTSPVPDNYSDLWARRYAADGTPLGGEFQVNSFTTGDQRNPVVGAASDGSFVVAWAGSASSGPDTSGYSVHARRFAADGTPLGAEFQVNSYTTGAQSDPALAVSADGAFLVGWTSALVPGTDTEPYSLQAQRYASDGNPVGDQFQLNSFTTGGQGTSSAASDGAEGFVIAWGSSASPGDDDYVAILGGRLDSVTALREPDFQINQSTGAWQWEPEVATDAEGNFVVVWMSQSSSGSDSDLWSIQARRYDALFRDGYESGGTARWSISQP